MICLLVKSFTWQHAIAILLPSANEVYEGNVFTGALSVHRSQCLPRRGDVDPPEQTSTQLGRYPSWADTPIRQTTPPLCRHPQADNPPR